jgi:hypothetical protein
MHSRAHYSALHHRQRRGQEERLIDYLAIEKFAPEWWLRDEPNASIFIRNGLLCADIARVSCRADGSSILTEVQGAHKSQCN